MALKLGFGFLVAILLSYGECANIVFFLGMSSYSHRIPTWPLTVALAERGHNVTFVSPIPSKDPHPKVFDYVPRSLKEFEESWTDEVNFFQIRKDNPTWGWEWFVEGEFAKQMCEIVFNDEEFMDWVKRTKVDLLYIDTFANECAFGLGHYWGSKVIFYDTTTSFTHFVDAYGLPDETHWIPPVEVGGWMSPMTFSQRLRNALLPVVAPTFRSWFHYPVLDKIVREKLDAKMPSLQKLEKETTNMVFLNNHYSNEFARALPPNVISIAGIALEGYKHKPLPKDMDDFLKKGDGFVYVSFGSHVGFHQLDKEIQDVFIGAMKALSHIQFVWKVNNETLLDEFPAKNVHIRKWMPQQEILAHPKCKAFISHSGLGGLIETINYAVPVIGFPFFSEQEYNLDRLVENEAGIKLEIVTVTQPQLESSIKSIISDPKYRKNMQKVSKLFKDRPQTPLETAVWWSEYVIRHSKDELKAIKPLSLNQSWWVRRQLDVWGLIFLSVGVTLALLIKVTRKVLQLVCGSSSSSKKLKTS